MCKSKLFTAGFEIVKILSKVPLRRKVNGRMLLQFFIIAALKYKQHFDVLAGHGKANIQLLNIFYTRLFYLIFCK